jgi:23S rRNA pseudouridine2605 synthase
MIRLDRLLATRGVGTRKEVRRMVRGGRVTVAGDVIRDPAQKVAPDAEARVDGELCEALPRLVLFHKPAGVVSTLRDNMGRLCLTDVIPPEWLGKLHPVGRLDAETTGLLPFSAEGSLTQHLLHPRRAYEREYVATVEAVPAADLVERLAAGVQTADGVHTARVISIEGNVVQLVVTEGRHRMVRRMLANSGHPVLSLHRLRFGPFVLGDLEPGDWRPASDEALNTLA